MPGQPDYILLREHEALKGKSHLGYTLHTIKSAFWQDSGRTHIWPGRSVLYPPPQSPAATGPDHGYLVYVRHHVAIGSRSTV